MPKCVNYYQFVSRQIGERPLEGAQQTSSAWSRAGSRPPLRGASRPGCPAFGGASVVCSALAPRRLVGPLRALPGGPSSPPGFAPGLGPCGPPGPRWPWLGPPPPGAARARGSGGCGGFPALPPAPGVARPIGGPPAPVGAAPSLPRRAPLRRGRVRPPAAVPRRGLGPLLGGSGPGGSCRLPPPVGGAALLPPPGLRPFPRRAGPPSPGPCRAARLPPWAAAPPPSGGGWGGYAALFRAAAPSVGAAPVGAVVGVPWGRGPVPTLPTLRQGSRQAAQAPPLTACVPGGKLSPRARPRALSFDMPFILGLTW